MDNYAIHTLLDTKKLAEKLALKLRCGDVVTVAGDLGAGKTTFAQFLVAALSPQPVEVTSPTFNLLQTYPIRTSTDELCEFFHFDLYRIDHASALVELGLDDALAGISLIEWPERLMGYPLPVSLALSLTLAEDGLRHATVLHAAPHLKDILS
jgi:tRNA threonylcarbamoyl adenosine modification protein YjeE